MQGDKSNRQSSTRSDKLITDYLSRQSASHASRAAQGQAVRPPLAALENLQEALSELQLAYGMSRPAVTSIRHCRLTFKAGQTADSNVDQGVRPNREQAEMNHAITQERSAMLQSHPIQCSPIPDTHCVSRVANEHPISEEPASRLHSLSAAASTLTGPAACPSTPVQSVCHNTEPDRAEQGSLSVAQSSTKLKDSSAIHMLSVKPAAFAYTSADAPPLTTSEGTPTAYFTPHESASRSANQFHSPSPDGTECWYTPSTSEGSAFNDDGVSHNIAIQLDHTLSSGQSISRADSPSLLYGQGSAFSAETLGQGNDLSSQWLIR